MELSEYGSWASILSLAISFLTLILVLYIKKKFMFQSRIEEHTTSLREIASNLSKNFQNFENNVEDIDNSFAIANVKLRNIQKGASDHLVSDVKKARRKIYIYRFKYSTGIDYFMPKATEARKIYTAINVVVEELMNVKKELIVGN